MDGRDVKPAENLLSAGRFAQAAGLSRKALRHYDQVGILKPEYTDPETGYRYYSWDQSDRARLIRMLRAMDMPLITVSAVLDAADPEEAMRLVTESRQDFEGRVEDVRRASHRVLAYFRKENDQMSVEVKVQDFPAQKAVSIRKSLSVPAFHQSIPVAIRRLHEHITSQGAALAGDPLCFYYGPVNENDDGPVEFCWPFTGEVQPAGEIVVREIPAHQAAVGHASLEQSRYPEILDVWDGVVQWVHEHGKKMTEETITTYEIWPEDETVIVVVPFVN